MAKGVNVRGRPLRWKISSGLFLGATPLGINDAYLDWTLSKSNRI